MSENTKPAGLGIDEWMVAWTPKEPSSVKVGPWPDKTGWSDGLQMTTGCCWLDWHERSVAEKVALMFIHFHTAVVRDGIDPEAAHRAFLNIAEYRRRIAPDLPGAEGGGGLF